MAHAQQGSWCHTWGPPEVVLLQPVCIIDFLCQLDETTAARLGQGQLGGSSRVSKEQLHELLMEVGEFTVRAGGSASNVAQGLATGFGVSAAVVGARGSDEYGALWEHSMRRSGVDTQHVVKLPGATGRSVVLLAAGERSCRTCLDPQVSFPGSHLQEAALKGASWLFVSGYAAYQPDLLPQALQLARQLRLKVALDLASWELLQHFWPLLQQVLSQGLVDLCFCNQDEAQQLGKLLQLPNPSPDAALHYLLRHCHTVVVTLGSNGCIAGTHCSNSNSQSCSGRSYSEGMPPAVRTAAAVAGAGASHAGGHQEEVVVVVRQPGVPVAEVVDVTGAGDFFAAGFLHGRLRGWSLQRCAEAACLSGAAAVQGLGADLSQQQLHWMHQQLLGPHAACVLAAAAGEVAREQLAAFGLVEKLGRGVVYFGSARVPPHSNMWTQTQDLARQVSQLMGSTTWTGGGPGLMQAATQGALEAGGPVGGIRIAKEAGTAVLSGAGYLPAEVQVTCGQLSSRKNGLIQAGCRRDTSDRTAFIFLPGGLGTMDELFELLTLIQLRKLPHQQHQQRQHVTADSNGSGSSSSGGASSAGSLNGHSTGGGCCVTPVVLVDYEGFYGGFLTFLQACEEQGMLRAEELQDVVVASSNNAVVALLAAFYGISSGAGTDAAAD